MKNVIVTGATSMLGVSLIERLVADKSIETVFAVIRKKSPKRSRVPISSRIKIIECDINEYSELLCQIDKECDTFYHMAWPRTATYDESIEDMLIKCDATKTVITAVEVAEKLGCKKFIGAGSQSEYGLPLNGIYSVHLECKPVRADGVFHLLAGWTARKVAKSLKIKCIWMRIFSVYGINDRMNSMINMTIDKLMKGEHCSFTKAEQRWDYVYSDDVAEAFYLVGDKVNESKIYNIAYGESKPLREYIEAIRDVVAYGTVLGIGELNYPENAIKNMIVDISDLVNDTGWIPKTNFKSGIRKIYESKLKVN